MDVRYGKKKLTEESLIELFTEDLSDLSESESDSEDVNIRYESESDVSFVDEQPVLGNVDIQGLSKKQKTDSFAYMTPQWNKAGPSSFTVYDFDDSLAGIQGKINDSDDPKELDYFLHLFGGDIVQHIANETNRYYQQLISSIVVKSNSKLNMWIDTDVGEMFCFLALMLLMSHVKKNSIKAYWSTDVLINTPFFANIMSQNRFILLLRCLHFANNNDNTEGKRLFKIEAIFNHFNKINSEVFRPYVNLCIDESLILYKGRLMFKQYIPSKRARFGIKIFVLSDCKSGFCLSVIIYTGKNTELKCNEYDSLPSNVVMSLMEPYFDRGHKLFVDNWYTSPKLFELLMNKKVNACGTVRKNRKGLPVDAKLKSGEMEVYHSDKSTYVHWMDRRDVRILSSVHKEISKKPTGKINYKTKEVIEKPNCVLDYNANMGAVDQGDMQVSSLRSGRKSLKWYKKVFQHLLDLTIRNAMVLQNLKTNKKTPLEEFRLSVIRQIIEKFHISKAKPKGGRPSTQDSPLRLTERHFPSIVPPTLKKSSATRVCIVCSHTQLEERKRRESRYMCKVCDVGLCVVPCFEKYHTQSKY